MILKMKNNNFDDQVEGRNSVLELLESGKDINKIFVTRGEKHGSINKIIAKTAKSQEAKNLPQTKSVTETGTVNICTILLERNSSAQERMAIPGIKRR